MNQIVPSALLFDYRFRVPACSGPSSRKTGALLRLPESAELPALSTMDGSPHFATLSVGWNAKGLGVRVAVRGRTATPGGDSKQLNNADCVELWIDTRPTGNVHRATGYCHRLACLPADDSADGQPAAVTLTIPQQREVRAELQARHVKLRRHARKNGYDLEIWIPAGQLYGFDQIEEQRQLGFYSLVRDSELGEQPLTVTDDFPFVWDPSLWINLELTDE